MSELAVASSLTTEKNLLWSIIRDNAELFVAEQVLQWPAFFYTSHQTIYRAMLRLMEAQSPIDITTLHEELERSGELESVGGLSYIADLGGDVPTRGNVAAYAKVILEKARLRSLQEACYETALRADGKSGRYQVLRDEIDARLLSIGAEDMGSEASRASDLDRLLARMETERSRPAELLGLPTGIARLDQLTRGFQRGEITFCGAMSGGGKSGLMVQSAIEACKMGVPALLFSLEMDRAALHRRILCAVSGVPYPRVFDPKWASREDMRRIYEAAEAVKAWPLYIVDKSGISIEQLTATARLHIRRHGVGLVGVDYVQIVTAKERDERMRVSAISRGLTRLAKDEKVPVLALSQLSRPDRREENRIPSQSSLRESSQLENDAHTIIIFHRERDQETGRLNSDGIVRVAKQRNGETADYPVHFNRASLTFTDGHFENQKERAA